MQAGVGAALALSGLPYVRAAKPRTVVIVGGGIAGAHTARGIKTGSPETRVILIEKRKQFVSGPAILGYLFGERDYSTVSYSYDRLKQLGVELVHDRCENIDLKKQQVITESNGNINYDYLVITTGIHLAYEDIEGLDMTDTNVGSLLDRDRTQQLRRQLEQFKGGTVLVNVPNSALVCPPAPYEYCMLLGEMIKRKKLDASIILVDAGVTPQPPPLSKNIAVELQQRTSLIEYVPVGGNISAIDHGQRIAYTSEGDEYEYDLATLVPVNTVSPLIAELGLGDGADVFIGVDPLTMRCHKDSKVFALGDVARSPLGKSGFAADVSARICVETLLGELRGKATSTDTRDLVVACYPFTDRGNAMLMEVSYHISNGANGLHMKSQKKTTGPLAENIRIRSDWESKLHGSIFG